MTGARPLSVLILALCPSAGAGIEVMLAPHRDQVIACSATPDDPRLADLVAAATVVVIATNDVPPHQHPVVNRLLHVHRNVPVVVVADLDDDETLLGVLRQGTAGYLLPDITASELLAALTRAAAGQVVIDPTMAARLVLQQAHRQPQPPPDTMDRYQLRPRELQVLELLVEGRSNQEIAEHLNLGKETVKTYLRAVYRKLGARDRLHAVAIALGRS